MMDILKISLWKQFGASIDMVKDAIIMWPENSWETDKKFFYDAYHVLVFLDYYLTIPAEKNFSAMLPFTLMHRSEIPEGAIDDVIPDRIYSRMELLEYCAACRIKCCNLIRNLTEERLEERWIEQDGVMNYAVLELLLYNMRHVQHHAAQLNMMLRQKIDKAPGWVSRAKDD